MVQQGGGKPVRQRGWGAAAGRVAAAAGQRENRAVRASEPPASPPFCCPALTFVSAWSGATPERTRPKGVGSASCSVQRGAARRTGGAGAAEVGRRQAESQCGG